MSEQGQPEQDGTLKSLAVTRPVLVSGPLFSGWGVALFLLALVCVLIAADPFLRTTGSALKWCSLVAGFGLILCAASFLMRLARRQWLQVTPYGFTITGGTGARSFRDEDIVAVTGPVEAAGTDWRWLWLEARVVGGSEVVFLNYRVQAHEADPLNVLLERISLREAKQAVARKEQTGKLNGDGWHLDQQALHVHAGPAKGTYPLDDFAFVAILP
jgi:hypothetical protein